MRGELKRLFSLSMAAALLATGCTTRRQTDPARTATEQLLLSTAADCALQTVDLGQFARKKVFVDATYFESYDSKYVIGSIRDALNRAGALLVTNSKESEITIEPRSGALSTDDRTTLFGLPAMGLPVPLSGTLSTPELALYKAQRQYSTFKLALLAYETHSGEHIYSSGSIVGRAHDNYFSIIFVPLHRTSVPEMEKQKTPKSHEGN